MMQLSQARAATKKHVILFLAANPRDTGRVALDREARAIHVELKRTGHRDRFDFVTRWAAEPLDLLRELRELKPTIVHFSGHGAQPTGTTDREQGRDVVAIAAPSGEEPGGVMFDGAKDRGDVVTPEAFVQTLAATGPQVRLVVLNACFTEPMARALLAHVDCVVGMSGAIHDDAARNFAIGFYGGLGERESIAAAFAQGTAAINLSGLPDADRPQLQVRDGFDASALILAAIEPTRLLKLPCPYPGMRSYQADDAEGFHGRDAEVDELLGRMRAGEREIYVIGPSGSGKSSLVAAGLLRQLARGVSGLGPFVVRTVRPGERPAARLCEALDAPGQPLVTADRIATLLARRGPSSSVLLVVDQLEELFTLAIPNERASFLAALRALRAVPRCVVICTLRADFFGALIESSLWPEHRDRKQLSHLEVSPLRGEALREAIAAPAREIGVEVEPELVERLLADAASEPGILPLLQETLVQLWDKRTDQVLTLAHYLVLGDDERGGLAVALARRADATLRRFAPAQTDIARRILLRLISFGEGRSDTRRQQSRAQLCAADEDATAFAKVLQTMIDDRLLTIDEDAACEPRVDLAHEIMITAWPTLASWIQVHKANEQRRRWLESLAERWIEHGRSSGTLLSLRELAEADVWREATSTHNLGQSSAIIDLIDASKKVHRRRRTYKTNLLGLLGIAIGVIVILLICRIVERHERYAYIAEYLGRAEVMSDAAGQLARLKDAVRTRALELFTSGRWHEGESLWHLTKELGAMEYTYQGTASDYLECVLETDGAPDDLREQFVHLTSEQLIRAERDHNDTFADRLRWSLAHYDDGRSRYGRYRATSADYSRAEFEIVPLGTQVWIERPGEKRYLLGQSPLKPQDLPSGPTILIFEAPGRLTTRLPILLSRGETLRQRIELPFTDTVPPGMIYVPAGRFSFGSADEGTRSLLNAPPMYEVQIGAYYIGRDDVTLGQWLEFLDDLPPDERRRRSPSSAEPQSSLMLTEIGPKRWRLRLAQSARIYIGETDSRLRYSDEVCHLEHDWRRLPATAISYDDAQAYVAWLDRIGRVPGARLCDEYEWERAARGADGRKYPTGNKLILDDDDIDARDDHNPFVIGISEVGSRPVPRSPVGANDMGGNIWEWTRSVESSNSSVLRGGHRKNPELSDRVVFPARAMVRNIFAGIRICATATQ